MDEPFRLTRRRFLRNAAGSAGAALAWPAIVPAVALGRNGRTAPSDRIVLGAIGLGFGWPMGLDHEDVRFAAVCDVLEERRTRAKEIIDSRYGSQDCAAYRDFRELLARRDIDAVYIATPDHWHALIAIAAARAGKDIYCQKPLTHTVAEGRAVCEAVRRYGVVFQHGTQQRSDPIFRRGEGLVRNGRIGRLHTIRLGVPSGATLAPQPAMPVPDGFDYDLWLGPAPFAPFTMRRCFGPHTWYFISDYSVGYISGWGVHHLDSAQRGNGTDLTGPLEVDGRGVFPRDGLYDTAVTWRVEYRFANGVSIICTDTTRQRMGVLYEGTEGRVFTWRDGVLETEPASLRDQKTDPDEIHLYASDDHFRNFLDCIRTRKETAAPVEVAHRSTTLANIGAISMGLGRPLRWDPEREDFVGDPEANRLLSKPMRAPWRL
ncbi:MAG: Gfo/Idh/MocA family oxidoreductase [Planctomycetes bacterium]|nr:Gfo/Idh/MocA family oxidoreductase [Planctomycetota bacterium]